MGALSARAGRDCLAVSSAPSFLPASRGPAGLKDGRPGQEGLARPARAHHGTLTGRGAPLHKGRRAEPVSDRREQALVWASPHRAWGLHRCRRASAQHELLPPGLTLNSSESLLPCRGTRSSQPSPPSPSPAIPSAGRAGPAEDVESLDLAQTPGIRSLWPLLSVTVPQRGPSEQPQLHRDSCVRTADWPARSSCPDPPPEGQSPHGTSSEDNALRPLGCACRPGAGRGTQGCIWQRQEQVVGRTQAAARGGLHGQCPARPQAGATLPPKGGPVGSSHVPSARPPIQHSAHHGCCVAAVCCAGPTGKACRHGDTQDPRHSLREAQAGIPGHADSIPWRGTRPTWKARRDM